MAAFNYMEGDLQISRLQRFRFEDNAVITFQAFSQQRSRHRSSPDSPPVMTRSIPNSPCRVFQRLVFTGSKFPKRLTRRVEAGVAVLPVAEPGIVPVS